MRFRFHRPWIGFYWNTHLLHTVYGCFHPIMTELGGYNRDHMAYKAQNIPGLLPRKFADPNIDQLSRDNIYHMFVS